MTWDEEVFNQKLSDAISIYDRQQTAALCDELIAHVRCRGDVYPASDAIKVLQMLRRKRFFDLLEKVADVLIQAGQSAPKVRRLYAQALLDQSEMTAALNELESLGDDTAGNAAENAEACGLMGRAYKQLYVDANEPTIARNQEYLEQAIAAYLGVYQLDTNKHTWPGINVVALLCRAERDGVQLKNFAQPRQQAEAMARAILKVVEDDFNALDDERKADTWGLGTATEACVALNRMEDAQKWCARYVQSEYADAFELASTLRQFTQVWQLDPASPITTLLQAELLRREGGFASLKAEQVRKQHQSLSAVTANKANYEKVFGLDSFVSLDWYRSGLNCCRSVARIGTDTKRGIGTGFLICGKDIFELWGDELILVTNAHVLSNDASVKGALRPDDAVVYFEALSENGGKEVVCEIKEILWTSPPEKFDATFARLSLSISNAGACELSKALPLREDNQHIYIIGHPGGGSLSFSIHDNLLLDYEERFIHYRTPTEGGSSGSPVFNQQWKLIGLHHKGGELPKLNGQVGTYEANEGIWIQAIKKAVAQDLQQAQGQSNAI